MSGKRDGCLQIVTVERNFNESVMKDDAMTNKALHAFHFITDEEPRKCFS